ncbi:MAG: hypothetical protein NTW93_04260 [Phycisphaerae bacterium]|nr:hypothetical protein [Phycisphaerae bacterium]
MTIRAYIKTMLLVGLVTLSIGGILRHSRIHPIKTNYSNLVPAVSCILSILVVPTLFCFRKTIAYGYVINGFLVIVGTITMAHFSIAHWPNPLTLQAIFMNTLLADILILWGKFFIGKSIFDLEFLGYDATRGKKGITYRYPNMGWWVVHLAAVSIVYYLGFILWR